MVEKVEIYKTDTYKISLNNFEKSVAEQIDKKVMSLLENPSIADDMKHQHGGYCEIRVGKKYRVYCIRKRNQIGLLFVIGPAVHHKENFKKNKEYGKMFNILEKLNEEFEKAIKRNQ